MDGIATSVAQRGNAPFLLRLTGFVRERFPLASYVPLITVFSAAGFIPATRQRGAEIDALAFALTMLAVAAVFLHLRAADELKDAAIDRLGRPERPLPRGLVAGGELRALSVALLIVALLLSIPLGTPATLALVVVVGYVALADVEFAAAERIRRHLVIYALAHSPIVPLLLVFVWLSAGGPLVPPLAALAVLSWAAGLGFEVARKTRAPDEERPHVESYSAALGRRTAVVLAGGALALSALAGAAFSWAVAADSWAFAALAVAAVPGLLLGWIGLAPRLRQRQSEALASVIVLLVLAWPSVVSLAA